MAGHPLFNVESIPTWEKAQNDARAWNEIPVT